VIPWILVDSTQVPGGGELRLMRRGTEFSIKLDGNELMNSRLSGSEQALATLACEIVAARKQPRKEPKMLIGGLGMGFTLRAALGALPKDAVIDVAELVPAVVAWARGPMVDLHGDSLDDSRVHIHETDVGAMIGASASRYDAILLDVDNGPDGLSRPGNDRLYDSAGLSAAYNALHPGGVLAVWSSAPDQDFMRRLRQAGFGVDEKRVRAHGSNKDSNKGSGGGARHVIWLAKRD
jgi:spermidine synthase